MCCTVLAMTESTHTTVSAAVLTVEEAALMLRISRQSAYQAVHTGEIPTVKIGRRMLVPRVALERMLDIPNDERPEATSPGVRTTVGVGGARVGTD
jgi:excisionase family DNA binding protein